MGEKKIVTFISLSLILDGEFSKYDIEQMFIPNIRETCLRDGMKYAPEVWIDDVETKEMEIVVR